MKKFMPLTLGSITVAILNFLLFIFIYNRLATPYQHEAWRAKNADFIISFALPSFVLIALISTFTICYLARKFIN
jgi:hypothetical protein